MGNRTRALTIDGQVNRLYRRVLRNLGLLGLLVVALVMAAMIYFDGRLVDALSGQLIDKSTSATIGELRLFFDPVKKGMRIVQQDLAALDPGGDDFSAALYREVSPLLRQFKQISGFILADLDGNAYFLIRRGDEFLGRWIDRRRFGAGMARWQRWKDGKVVETWTRTTDYDPRTRPWYRNAVDAKTDDLYWTAPYLFYTAKVPGVTVSAKWRQPDTGQVYITAFDVALSEISRFTMNLRPSAHGKALVTTEQLDIVGLPAGERFRDARAAGAALLSKATELNLPEVTDAFAAWEKKGRSPGIFRFSSGAESWWAGFHSYRASAGARAWIGVLVPEQDFLAGITEQRNLALSSIVGGGFLVGIGLMLASLRSIRRNLHQAVSRIERNLGQYRLTYKIGDGGNGAVYRARHALLRRPTAIKLMHPEYARSETAKARFEHEVQIMSGLTHPNTVAVYDYGQTPEGTLYYAMEYLTGITLEQLVESSGPQPPGRVIDILLQVCGSLAEAHNQGLIHRDVKPANIMVCERGGLYDVVKVLDFGLVKEIAAADPHLTHSNVLVGTPLYMAPEIISSPGSASARSDLYALGCVGYFLLTGQNVFAGGSAVEICAAHLHDPPLPPSQRTRRPVPEDLEALVLMCLEKRPEQRPASAETLAAMLAGCVDYRAWTAADARAWWASHREILPLDDEQQTHAPLSNTQLLVDVEERLPLRPGAGDAVGGVPE